MDVRAAESGRGHAVIASLSSGGELGSRRWSAIDVVMDRSGRYAFVSLEYAGRIAVFDLPQRRLVGTIGVPAVNVGLAISPDGRKLYATAASGAFPVRPASHGSLAVIDVSRAERDPAHAVAGSAPAGCDPVRVVAAGDGSVRVSARGSNAVLEYSAKALRSNPRAALEGVMRVGAEPVGLQLLDGGRRLLVLDSDRFRLAGGTPELAVVDTARRRVLGTVATGAFPREAASAGGQLVVSNYDGAQLQTVQGTRRLIAP